jgi:photosystem II stability/assembly factor-like uncharacterized protein
MSGNTSPYPPPTEPSQLDSKWAESEIPRVLQASWITEDGTLYASAFNTIYKTTDRGATCVQLKAFNSQGIDSIHINKENTIFVSPGLGAPASEAGLWCSLDGGGTWTKVISLPVSCSFWAIDEDANGRLFAGVYTRGSTKNARIYRSIDFGASWTSVYFDSKARHMHDIAVDKITNKIYATVGDKFVPQSNVAYILCSDDGGKNWKKILKDLPQMVAVEAIPGARLFGTDDVGNGELYRTIDDKKTVKVLDTGAHSCGFWIRRDPASGRIYVSFVTGEGPKKISGLYTSNDNGQTWTLCRTFQTNLPYEGSSRSSNFQKGTLYYSVRLEGCQRNGVQITNQT